jgi:hypothetical protein
VADVFRCEAHPAIVVDAARELMAERDEREERPEVGRVSRGRIDRDLRLDRLHREERRRRQVEAENDNLSTEPGMEKETSKRLGRRHGKATGELTVARADWRIRKEKHGNVQAQLIVSNAGPEASRLARADDNGITAKQAEHIAEFSKPCDLRRFLRVAQQDIERLERANQSPKGHIRGLTSEVVSIREENNTVKGGESSACRESCANGREARSRYQGSWASIPEAREPNMLRLYPFRRAHTGRTDPHASLQSLEPAPGGMLRQEPNHRENRPSCLASGHWTSAPGGMLR